MKSVQMRVPLTFKKKADEMSRKYGYKHTTKFLKNNAERFLENAEAINDFFHLYTKKKKR